MHTGKDEFEFLKLDEVFKKNLALIRPHILTIQSIEDANLCRMWLEKLSLCSGQEQILRNAYICKLRCQVKSGILNPPFNSPPPDGELVPFALIANEDCEDFANSSWSDFDTTAYQHDHSEEGDEFFSNGNQSVISSTENHHINCQCAQLPQQYEKCGAIDQEIMTCLKPAVCFHLSRQNPEICKMDDCAEEMIPVHENKISSLKSLKFLYENKISSLKSEVNALKEQNKKLQDLVKLQTFQKQNKTNDCDWNALYEEIKYLKTKIIDVQNSKNTLKENHKEIVSHYQREMGEAIGHLCCRLNDTKRKNREVEMKLDIALDQLGRFFMQLNKGEIANGAMDEWRGDNQNLNPNLKMLDESKNEEVKNLEEILKSQCKKMQEEVNLIKNDMKIAAERRDKKLRAKVRELQKIINEHTRMKAKLLTSYNNKLIFLQKERHLEVKGLELQLYTQRAEIVASLSQEKQKELEMVAAKLEDRYKDMLMDTENKFLKRQEEDQMRISHLEAELKILLSNECNNF